jgi:hypothetical protein
MGNFLSIWIRVHRTKLWVWVYSCGHIVRRDLRIYLSRALDAISSSSVVFAPAIDLRKASAALLSLAAAVLRCCPFHLAGTMQGNCSIKCAPGPGTAGLCLSARTRTMAKLGCSSPWSIFARVYFQQRKTLSICQREREKGHERDRFSYARILLSARLCLLNKIQTRARWPTRLE